MADASTTPQATRTAISAFNRNAAMKRHNGNELQNKAVSERRFILTLGWVCSFLRWASISMRTVAARSFKPSLEIVRWRILGSGSSELLVNGTVKSLTHQSTG